MNEKTLPFKHIIRNSNSGAVVWNLSVNESPKHFTNKTLYALKLFLLAILFYCLIKSVPIGRTASPILISTSTIKKISYTFPKPLLGICGRDIFFSTSLQRIQY